MPKKNEWGLFVGGEYDWCTVDGFQEELFGDSRTRPIFMLRKIMFGTIRQLSHGIPPSHRESSAKYIRELDAEEIDKNFNPRKHTKEWFNIPEYYRYKNALDFIREYGFLSPIEVILTPPSTWRYKYKIYDGAHRRLAAGFLGIEKIPCIVYSNHEIKTWTGEL